MQETWVLCWLPDAEALQPVYRGVVQSSATRAVQRSNSQVVAAPKCLHMVRLALAKFAVCVLVGGGG